MKLVSIIALIVLFAISTDVSAEPNVCEAVDCACNEITDDNWQSICRVHESVISKECVANKGKPRQYCRMHGPSGFPVALSTPKDKPISEAAPISHDQLQVDMERVDTAIWSLQQDLSSAMDYQGTAPSKAISVAKIMHRNAESLFVLQRDNLIRWVALGGTRAAFELSNAYDAQWRAFAAQLTAGSEKLMALPGASGKNQNALEYRLARQTAKALEYAGHLRAQLKMNEEAASAWKSAAKATEQLLAKAQSANAPVKYIKYYREQAAARWHRATYYWLEHSGGSSNEAQASFQSAEQILNQSFDEASSSTPAFAVTRANWQKSPY